MSILAWSAAAAIAGAALGWHLRGHARQLTSWCTLHLVIPAARWSACAFRWIERHRRQEPPSGPISVVAAPRPIPPTSGASRRPTWGGDVCVVTGCHRPFSRTTERYGPDFGYCEAHAHAVDEHGAEWAAVAKGGA